MIVKDEILLEVMKLSNSDFQYIKIKNDSNIEPLSVIYMNSKKVFEKGLPLELYENLTVGYLKLDNFYIIQDISFRKDTFHILYGIFDKLPKYIKLPKVNFNLYKLYILVEYWQNNIDNYFSEKILYLIEKLGVPSEGKECKKLLYRGLKLSPRALRKLEKGKSIQLKKKPFSSWSEHKDIAIGFAGDDSNKGILMSYFPTKEEILINVSILKKLFKQPINWNYNIEREVILKNSKKMLTVSPKQIIYTSKTVKATEEGKDFLNRTFLEVEI